MLQLLRGVMLN